jgi:hypothetical protein
MRYLASRWLLAGAYCEDFATGGMSHRELTPRVRLMDAMSFSVPPMNTGRSQFASHFRETETERVSSSMNSEPSLRSLEDLYGIAAEFGTTAHKAPAPAI